jgi:branched-chain amino acid transport system permease protein
MPSPETFLQLLIIGLTNGAVIGLNAIAVTVIYGTVRTLNLAYGDVFALTMIVITSVVSALGLNVALAPLAVAGGLALTLGIGAVFGGGLNLLVERAAFAPFKGRSKMAPLMATLGLSFVFYQISLIWRYFLPNWLPGEHRSVPGVPELPRDRIPELLPAFNLLGESRVIFTPKELAVILIALACAVGVGLFLQRTRTGRAIRAISQNEDLAYIVGVNPASIIRRAFMLGGALAGMAAFVFALYYTRPFANAGAQSGLIAFAAAILGGIGNPVGALLAGLLLGVGAAFSDRFLLTQWTPVLIQALLIGLLVLRPSGLGGDEVSGAVGSERDAVALTPNAHRSRTESIWLTVAFTGFLLYPVLDQTLGWYRLSSLTSIGIFVVLALGLNILLGWAGLLNLGFAVSFGVGGYVAAILATQSRMEFGLIVLASAGAAGLLGALIGPLTRHLRNDTVAIVTLALGTLARQTLVNLSNLAGDGGSIAAVPAPVLFGFSLSTPLARYYLVVAVILVAVLASWRLLRSRVGRAWRANSEDEMAAQSAGVNVGHYRTLAFVVSAALAGVAGALYASTFTYIDADAVDFRISAMALAMVILGGAGSVPGAVVGTVLLASYDQVFIPALGALLAQWQMGDVRFGSALDARGLSYLNFGLALYLTVLLRTRRRS